MRPPLRRIAAAFCVTVNVPVRFTRTTLSNSSIDIFLIVRSLMIPELFTRISRPPRLSPISIIIDSTCSGCVTSHSITSGSFNFFATFAASALFWPCPSAT